MVSINIEITDWLECRIAASDRSMVSVNFFLLKESIEGGFWEGAPQCKNVIEKKTI